MTPSNISNVDLQNAPVARWLQSRQIIKRIVVTGTLTLRTPARFGGGRKSDVLTDMPLQCDPQDGMPLLAGTSIAGAMRAYLREWTLGYEKESPSEGTAWSRQLFGDVVDEESRESYLIIEDTRAETIATEFRTGVRIDPQTRMVREEKEGGQLYDMELLEAGTQFPLRVELAIPDDETQERILKQALAVALTGFERGEIGLGARKRRGFGECEVTNWQVQIFDLTTPTGLIDWLKGEERQDAPPGEGAIAARLGVELPPDLRKRFWMKAIFKLNTSLLIRSGGIDANAPDMSHLTSQRKGVEQAILSGTSLAGAVRARALRIANTIISDKTKSKKLVADIFGPDEIKELGRRSKGEVPRASRAVIREREVKGKNDLIQTRIRIDRFTGGTLPGALFTQQPVFGGEQSQVCVEIELRQPDDAHIGLLLHILKDLWTSDLPLGGEASVGRGRLRGMQANLTLQKPDQPEVWWRISSQGEQNLHIESSFETIEKGRQELDNYAKAVKGSAK